MSGAILYLLALVSEFHLLLALISRSLGCGCAQVLAPVYHLSFYVTSSSLALSRLDFFFKTPLRVLLAVIKEGGFFLTVITC